MSLPVFFQFERKDPQEKQSTAIRRLLERADFHVPQARHEIRGVQRLWNPSEHHGQFPR